jgi:hypothetical protein
MITQEQRNLRNAVVKHLRASLSKDADPHAEALVIAFGSVIEGVSVERALGAPGDWGYGTPIGDALFAHIKSIP